MTTDTYSVSYITNTMRGAPVINGNTPGCLLAVLDALLINGWGLAAASTLVVAGGIATATFANATPWEVGAVIEVGGATPAAINGRARVLASSGNTLTFATSAGDGSYGGSIGIKYASAGWEKVFTGTNKAVYRSTDVTGARFDLRVDDSNNLFARVRGFEVMSDVDTGTGPFPTDALMSGGGYWHKSVTSNATANAYLLAADGRLILQAIALGGSSSSATAVYGFGEGVHASVSGDAFATVLSVAGLQGPNNTHYGGLSGASADGSPSNGAAFFARGWQGLGGAVYARPVPESGSAISLSGADATLGSAPAATDGRIRMARMLLKDQGAPGVLRSVVAGCWFVPQLLDSGLFLAPFALNDGSADLAGRRLAAVFVGSSYASRTGTAFVDVTGPWR